MQQWGWWLLTPALPGVSASQPRPASATGAKIETETLNVPCFKSMLRFSPLLRMLLIKTVKDSLF